ncbi:DUF3299 domain-containing protein [Sinobacterium caligoides]|uniref:DUF3299 domain-containing protein n=1 Tax=Sinobacterium caligoides TaxID=933926 RepID=UPI000F4CF641|nr:DUF3299 domain-containing protein [Sinobacterium caligoides]
MLRVVRWSVLAAVTLTLLACEQAENEALADSAAETATNQQAAAPKQASPGAAKKAVLPLAILPATAFKPLEWVDLIPKEDLEALEHPPGYIADVEDGSFEDQISSQINNSLVAAADDRYQQALVSTDVVPAMNNRPVRVPGFIVPLEFNDKQEVTQFFLVPYFGACIHVPPPPPNQIIFVRYPPGLKQEELYTPYWVSGVLETSLVENDMATAAYSMQMQSFETYVE